MFFIDGQNLFHAARKAFGYETFDLDPFKLAGAVCETNGWHCRPGETTVPTVHFYTGVPSQQDSPRWSRFWQNKLAAMGRRSAELGVHSRPVRYREQTVRMPDGERTVIRVGQEKGVDVRIALDAIRYANDQLYDVAVIVSQDQDMAEVANEIKLISRRQVRWIKVVSAFPSSESTVNQRGIYGTDWLKIDRQMYDSCSVTSSEN